MNLQTAGKHECAKPIARAFGRSAPDRSATERYALLLCRALCAYACLGLFAVHAAQTGSRVTGARQIALFAQNQAPVSMLAFSPDGKTLASAHHDQSVVLWDLGTAEPNKQLLGRHRRPVTGVVFSPDGRMVASSGIDRNVMLWDVAKRARIGEPLRHPGIVHMLAFDAKHGSLGTVSGGKHVMVWDLAKPEAPRVAFARELSAAYHIAFSAEATLAATANADNSENLFLWETPEWKARGAPFTHPGQIHAIAFSPQTNLLAAGGWSAVTLWDTATLQAAGELKHEPQQSVQCIAFSVDGTALAAGLASQRIALWDVVQRKRMVELSGGHEDEIWSVAFRPDGSMLASAGKDGTIALWQLESSQ